MNGLPVLGSIGFLIIAGGIGVWFQVRKARAALAEAFDFAWGAPDPALTEDAEVAALDELYFSPAYGEKAA